MTPARNLRRRWILSAIILSGSALPGLFAQDPAIFLPGNLVLSRSIYSAPATAVPFPGVLPNGAAAVADGTYPNVFNNEAPDPSFGITSPILLDQLSPAGAVLNTIDVTASLAAYPNNGVTNIATSFPSKSELGLSVTPQGTAVTFIGYNSAVNQLDVSNSNTIGHLDITDPVNAITPLYSDRTIIQVDNVGTILATPTHAYSGNNGRNVVDGGINGNYYMVGNAGNSGGSTTFAAGTVKIANGSNLVILTGASNTSNMFVGTPFSGTGIPAGAYVTSVISTTTFTINAPATGTAASSYKANEGAIQLAGLSFTAGSPIATLGNPFYNTSLLAVSMPVSGINVPAGAYILSIDNDKVHFTLSATPAASSVATASYTAGVPVSMLSDNTGVQMIARDARGESAVVGVVQGVYGAANGYQRGFSVIQIGAPEDKSGKDDNFRGATTYNNTLYITKGSGSNGLDAVYQVNPAGGSYVTPGTSAGLATAANAATASINPLPGWPATSTGKNETKLPITTVPDNTTPIVYHPFGIWFANDTTLYVADEGAPTIPNGAQGGLQKWLWNGATWSLAYTLTNGALTGTVLPNNKTGGTPYSVTNGGAGPAITPTTVGLRNIAGRVNGDGTVTVYAVTSTTSSLVDTGADPNQLVAITDALSFQTAAQAAGETFQVLKTAQYGEVLRGIASIPPIYTVKSNLLGEMQAFLNTVTGKNDLRNFTQAIADLQASLDATLWSPDGIHLAARGGDRVFDEEKDAIHNLQEVIQKSPAYSASLQFFIDTMVGADRNAAEIVIAEGSDPKKLDQADSEIARGDADKAQGNFTNAIDHYRNAWKQAQS